MPRQISTQSIHAVARRLADSIGLEVIHVSILPNRIVDDENNPIIPSFQCGETKREFYAVLIAAYSAVEYMKEFGPKIYT